MQNLNILETLRTKEELLNYFDEMGQNLTEEEIDTLKKSYAKAETNGSTLTMQQLGNVAGGMKPAMNQEEITTFLFRSSPQDRITSMRDKHNFNTVLFIFENQHDPRITEEEKHVANDVYFGNLSSEQRLNLLRNPDPDKVAPVVDFIYEHMDNPSAVGISDEEMYTAANLIFTGGMKPAVRHTEQAKETLNTILFSMSPQDRITSMRDKHNFNTVSFIFENQHNPRITEEEKHVANEVYFGNLSSEQRLNLLRDPDPDKVAPVVDFIYEHMDNPSAVGISDEEMYTAANLISTGSRTAADISGQNKQ